MTATGIALAVLVVYLASTAGHIAGSLAVRGYWGSAAWCLLASTGAAYGLWMWGAS